MAGIMDPKVFLKMTGWKNKVDPKEFEKAYFYFLTHVPQPYLHVAERDPNCWSPRVKNTVVRLYQWLQAIDYTRPVNVVWLQEGTRLLSFETPWQQSPGRWFSVPSSCSDVLAIDRSKFVRRIYHVRAPLFSLQTTAGDALVDWAPGAPYEYRHGGGTQYFIWDAGKHLTLGKA